MKIATWNVNSLRVRLPHILEWLTVNQPDVLALQEIKMPSENFPHSAFAALGYQALVQGQKTYNGVATLSRLPLTLIDQNLPHLTDLQSRLLATQIGDYRIINIYVPNGESLVSPKFVYKLQWLAALEAYLITTLKTQTKVIVLGDFNIAPTDEDIHDPAKWAGQVLCTPAERTHFANLLASGFKDSFRLKSQPPRLFSWWDYRALGFRRNAGLRIDLILVSEALVRYCQTTLIDKIPRGWTQPSDHTPVMLTLQTVACA